jgi:hypothetical protein
MNCYLSGFIGIALLTGTFSTMTISKDQHEILRKVLSKEQIQIYNKIIDERRNIYFTGILLGIFISYIIISFLKLNNTFHKLSLFLTISLFTSIIYYSLTPKSDYMLNHLKTEEQNKTWLEIYNRMKWRYYLGILLGSLSSIPIAYSLCK